MQYKTYVNKKHAFYIRSKPVAIPTKWELLRCLGREKLSPTAQLKVEWIIFYYTIGKKKAVPTARHFGITPKTLHKWLKRFDETRLETLEEVSRAPHRTRQREISHLQTIRIRKLRTAHLRWGKMKLQKHYKKEHGEEISSWKIQKVIESEHLYFDPIKQKRNQKRRKQAQERPKQRITQFVKVHKVHHLWHVDTVLLTMAGGGYRYLLTAIDDVSKLAYARLYKSHSSKQAADFLKRLHYLTEGEIINLHHDNGTEFEKDFITACKELSLPQWYSRVRTPKDNAVLERFNRTIQEEFVDMTETPIEDIQPFNLDLTEWLIEYNSVRPHQALDYLTPLEYIDILQHNKVLPMSPSHTSHRLFMNFFYNTSMQILVVEDEKKIAAVLKKGLQEELYHIDTAFDGEEGLYKATVNDYDFIILDLMLPKIDGISLCKKIRVKNKHIPILMLTAKDELSDKITGLDAGADDYVTKPFSIEEISARIRALLRRGNKADSVILSIGDVTLDPATKKVTRNDQTIPLTAREYTLLEYFMRNPNTILSKTQLLEHVWDYHYEGISNIVETYIKYLRKKLKIAPQAKELIHTVRGLGYIIKE